jgi:hypothetical protein
MAVLSHQHRTCLACGAPIVKRPREAVATWRNRISCGGECGKKCASDAVQLRRQRAIDSHALCGNPQCRRKVIPYNNESIAYYLARVYCSKPCARTMTGFGLRSVKSVPQPPKVIGARTIEEFLAKGGVITRGPPAFCAPTRQGELPLDIERKRFARIIDPGASPSPAREFNYGRRYRTHGN